MNLELWRESKRGWNSRSQERVNSNRDRLGLSPIDDVLEHILGAEPWLAADPILAPVPAGSIVQTGAWMLPSSTRLPERLEAFLQSGEPPVYIGFGSMPAVQNAAETLIASARAAGRRVVLSRCWAELQAADDGPDCIAIEDVDHSALFPRVALVIHHRGAGTTTAAASAGAPQLILPMFSDQFFWGRRIEDLGIGSSRGYSELSAERIAPALRRVLEEGVVARARSAAATIALDGAAKAAGALVTSDA